MSTVLVGLQGIVYYLSSGSRAAWSVTVANNIYSGPAPSNLAAMPVVRNVTLGMTSAEADVSSRASLAKLVALALDEYSIELEVPWNPTDTTFQALLAARMGRKIIAMAILDGDKTVVGSQGLWADFVVTEFTREEPIDKEMLAKAKLMPTASAVPPQWVQVSA